MGGWKTWSRRRNGWMGNGRLVGVEERRLVRLGGWITLEEEVETAMRAA
jgi:hypothetical protein